MKKYQKHSMQRYRKKHKLLWKRVGVMAALFAVNLLCNPELQAFASAPTPTPVPMPDLSTFQPLMILRVVYVIFMAIIAIMGGIQVAKSVQEWSTAMQQNDSTGTSAAIKGIVGGAIQASISVLMGIFGIVI